jgi:uncharacterized protein YceH (UPF0502 family)
MAHFESLADVERVLGELGDKGYAERMSRRPGQKEDRFRHLLGGEGGEGGDASAGAPIALGGFDEPVAPVSAGEVTQRSYDEPAGGGEVAWHGNGALEARVAALEAEVADLKAQLADLLE